MFRNRNSVIFNRQPTLYPLPLDKKAQIRLVLMLVHTMNNNNLMINKIKILFRFFFIAGSYTRWSTNNAATNAQRIIFCHYKIINYSSSGIVFIFLWPFLIQCFFLIKLIGFILIVFFFFSDYLFRIVISTKTCSANNRTRTRCTSRRTANLKDSRIEFLRQWNIVWFTCLCIGRWIHG